MASIILEHINHIKLYLDFCLWWKVLSYFSPTVHLFKQDYKSENCSELWTINRQPSGVIYDLTYLKESKRDSFLKNTIFRYWITSHSAYITYYIETHYFYYVFHPLKFVPMLQSSHINLIGPLLLIMHSAFLKRC